MGLAGNRATHWPFAKCPCCVACIGPQFGPHQVWQRRLHPDPPKL